MQFKEDSGSNFGKWSDNVSNILYNTANKIIASKILKNDVVADYGGANSLFKNDVQCKEYFCIDIDDTKKQIDNFINEDIITHKGSYDKVIIKLVMHYLTDRQIKEMLENIIAKEVIICQFVNSKEDILVKKKISNLSKESEKFFRNKKELLSIIGKCDILAEIDYICDREFYLNRLKLDTNLSHKETLLILTKKGNLCK